MKIYIRKMFPHDTTHEVSITTDIVADFFENKKAVPFIGKTTKEAIEKFVFGKVYKSEAVAQIKELWEELKYGGKQTG